MSSNGVAQLVEAIGVDVPALVVAITVRHGGAAAPVPGATVYATEGVIERMRRASRTALVVSASTDRSIRIWDLRHGGSQEIALDTLATATVPAADGTAIVGTGLGLVSLDPRPGGPAA